MVNRIPQSMTMRQSFNCLNNNRLFELAAELVKYGGEILIRFVDHLLFHTYMTARRYDRRLDNLPNPQKGRPHSLSQLPWGISVFCESLKLIVNKLIPPYQCLFRPGKSTTDQLFTMRQIVEQTSEKRVDTHHSYLQF